MSVYRPFERHDILFSTINTRPRVSVAFGSGSLWRGSTGASASLSLYGGIRGRYDVKASDFGSSGLSIYPLDPLDTNSIDKVIFVSGSYPSTGSIRFVRCTDGAAPNFFTDITPTRWYEEHFSPIGLLYDYYARLDSCYFTGSYDAYDVMFLADRSSATKPGSYFVFSGSNSLKVAGAATSFTAEAWYKPMLTGALPIVMGQPQVWSMGVGDGGSLVFRNDAVGAFSITGTMPGLVKQGRWNHIAVVVTTGSYVTFYVNGQSGGTAAVANLSGADQPLVVGSLVSASVPLSSSDGFIFETRLWNVARTSTQITSGLSGTLLTSGSLTGLIHYARFNDGPLGTRHGFAAGSGAFDHSPTAVHGRVVQYSGPQTAHWQPNDHENFRFDLAVSGNMQDMRLFHVPSLFYGKQIAPGSVRVTDGVYNRRGVVRVFQDDSRGGLYVSGSMTRDLSGEEYRGNPRRKVGNVFYSEGLIVFTDPALWDMFDTTSDFWNPVQTGSFPDLIALDFAGQGKLYTKTFNCRLGTAEANASNNPTFSVMDDRGTPEDLDDDIRRVVREDGTTYITAVGLYNEDRTLVAVAKLAQPLRKREKDKLNIRLKLDL